MGTTVTPNLGLIKPDSVEPAANWPAQVGANMDVLDSIPNAQKRIATTVRAADSSAVTSEAVLDTVIANLETGKIYRVTWQFRPISDAGGDDITFRIRENGLAGTVLTGLTDKVTTGNRKPFEHVEVEFTATSSGNKTFVGTLARASGTGNVRGTAGSTQPTYLYVDYVRDA